MQGIKLSDGTIFERTVRKVNRLNLRVSVPNGKFTNFVDLEIHDRDLDRLIDFLYSIRRAGKDDVWIYNSRGDRLFGRWLNGYVGQARRQAFKIAGNDEGVVSYLDRNHWRTEAELDKDAYDKDAYDKAVAAFEAGLPKDSDEV